MGNDDQVGLSEDDALSAGSTGSTCVLWLPMHRSYRLERGNAP